MQTLSSSIAQSKPFPRGAWPPSSRLSEEFRQSEEFKYPDARSDLSLGKEEVWTGQQAGPGFDATKAEKNKTVSEREEWWP